MKGKPPAAKSRNSISLVLGSGGARGLAHIGVIHWLKENGFKIESVSGCSMGALVGGVYAAGKLDVFEQWVCSVTKVDMVSLLDIAWERTGLIKGDKIIHTLVELIGDQLIEDLPFSYTAVAADIQREKEVWIQSGKLFDGIRASISLPLFFTPFKYNGVDLIDGGVLNPVPIAPTFGDDTEMTIAVNLGGQINVDESIQKQPLPDQKISQQNNGIKAFTERVRKTISAPGKYEPGIYDIANQAFDAMQSTIARQKLAAYPPDVTIEIPRNACGTMEFYRAAEMINFGYQSAEKCLASLSTPTSLKR